MKRSVQILVVAACLVPLLSPAREETMAERKQRITRKYLRDRSNIEVSELEVPYERPEDADVIQSEQYKAQADLQRRDDGPSAPLPPPPPLRRVPTAQERNWLLATDPLLDDPLDEDMEGTSRETDWTSWGLDQEDQSPYGTTQRESLYGRKPEAASIFNPSRYGAQPEDTSNQQGYKPFSFGRKTPGVQPGKERLPAGGYPGTYTPGQEAGSGLGTLDLTRDQTYTPGLNPIFNTAPNTGGLQTPYQRNNAQGGAQKVQGYTPYKSPYETRREQEQQQRSGTTGQQGYKPVNRYQQWKDRNPVQYDPTGDDAFINEHMPKSR